MALLRRVLIVDDDEDFLIAMKVQLKNSYIVLTTSSITGAVELLKKEDVDLVLLDVGLEGEDGLEGIKKIHAVHPSVGVAMLSGRSDVKTVVEAIRRGAVDYLTKPLDMESLATVIERADATRAVKEKCEAMIRSHLNSNGKGVKIVYKSKKMETLLRETSQIKGHDANVLIVGETGTGKELLARHIHEQEGNLKRPFIAVNCAAIPENLLESELFGHESGAFTGATRRRIGKFELADGGDIFLDEISTLKLDLQVKLLRVLQEKEFCRLGSNTPIKTNFRVISACNQSLEELVEKGNFRMDLYHRLRVIQLTLPRLRERSEDIPFLVDYFLEKFAFQGKKKQITDSALAKLMQYQWQGNVRELANVIQSLAIMAKDDVIDEAHFPSWVMNGDHKLKNGSANVAGCAKISLPTHDEAVASLQDYVRQAERNYIEHMLSANDGDKTKTAAALGIGRTTLYMKMKELELMK
jgi:DNA-binding NtrC family response regulator